MNRRGDRRSTAAAAVLALAMAAIVAACGPAEPSGSPGPSGPLATGSPNATSGVPTSIPSPGPSGSVAPPSPSASAASPAPSASPSAAETPGPTPTPATGNTSVQLCLKLPVAEVEDVLDVSGLIARPEPGDAGDGSCTYLSGDRAVAATSWITTGARQVITSFGDSAEPVQGLGDAAVWVDSIATLYIRKGTSLMGIAIAVAGPVAREDLKDACIVLGQAAAGRL